MLVTLKDGRKVVLMGNKDIYDFVAEELGQEVAELVCKDMFVDEVEEVEELKSNTQKELEAQQYYSQNLEQVLVNLTDYLSNTERISRKKIEQILKEGEW